jgi:uncharacterized protein YndB with AHSA1/START domain
VFNAPRDRVFAAYTDPELIRECWGPRDTTTVVNARVGHGRGMNETYARLDELLARLATG